jgi:hypothetical protein
MKALIRKTLGRIFPQMDPEHHVEQLRGKPAAEVFAGIYRNKVWGGRLSRGYNSGTGSRDALIVEPYVRAVSAYLAGKPPATIIDVGCGDFHVGWQLVNHTSITIRWIGCDIFPDLIESNRRKYRRSNLEFRTVDAIEDDIPAGDIVIVRQVLQHLSNAHIAKIAPKLKSYKVAIVTEHLPSGPFTPNMDKETGADHRPGFGSGVVLTETPFNLKALSETVICEVNSEGGLIRTTAYTF